MGAREKVLLLLFVFASTACSGVDNKPIQSDQRKPDLRQLDKCLESFDVALHDSLGVPPEFDSLHEALEWTSRNLPIDVRTALRDAGETMERKVNNIPEPVDPNEFMGRLHHAIALELSTLSEYQYGNCEIVIPDKLSNSLSLTLRLSEEPRRAWFEEFGLEDSYHIERAFLRMLTLQMSDIDWDPSWFTPQ